jgi:hypothetical protein
MTIEKKYKWQLKESGAFGFSKSLEYKVI